MNEDFKDIARHVDRIIATHEPNSRSSVVEALTMFIVTMDEKWRFRAGEGIVGSTKPLPKVDSITAFEKYDGYKMRNGR